MKLVQKASLLALAASTAATPSVLHAQQRRHAQVIILGSTSPPLAAGPVAPPMGPQLASSPFRIYDLSRSYVAYRMAEEFSSALAATEARSDTGMSAQPMFVAPVSSIAIPGWMSPHGSGATLIDSPPDCVDRGYRPSGILARSAEARRMAYYGMMSAIACEHRIPIALFDAVIIRESGYNPFALSSAKAYGLAQLMPGTAADLGVDRYDPVQNLRGGARYLRQQLDRFGQVTLALAAYNAGPGRVRNRSIPRISETEAYVSNIVANWAKLNAQPATSGRQ